MGIATSFCLSTQLDALLRWNSPGRRCIIIYALLTLKVTIPFAVGQHHAIQDTSPIVTQQIDTTNTSVKENFLDRSYLTGDWWGGRTYLSDRGVVFDLRYTASYQGLISGTGDKTFKYGGKVNAFLNLETKKMGLWRGGGLHTHFEYSHGALQPNLGTTLFSVNTAQFWPVNAKEVFVASSLYFSQQAGEKFSFLVGKFNPMDLLARDPFFGGWGIDRFMNLVLAAPPSGIVPPVFAGGVVNYKSKPVLLTLMVFDPDDRTTEYFPGDIFANGVNFSLTGSHNATIGGRKTVYAITTNYSTAEGTDYAIFGPDITNPSTKRGAWNVAIQFSHNLQEIEGSPEQAWGLYIKMAIADGNPNYVQSSIITGIAGKAIFLKRPRDNFGLAIYYYNLSDVLQSTLDPVSEFEDESCIELYYNFALTPWIYISADIQYINPALGDNDNALVGAIRTQIRF